MIIKIENTEDLYFINLDKVNHIKVNTTKEDEFIVTIFYNNNTELEIITHQTDINRLLEVLEND